MAHILRKYISNRGSALFMVISTMTALIISCMAMYFTMVSANSAQYAVFGQMQATQTAESVLDIVRNSLNPYNSMNPEFHNKLLALEPGESITTDANGFRALDPNVETGKNFAEIGAYSVTITCISKTGSVGDNLEMEFDYLVMSSFQGSRDAIHFTQKYSEKIEKDPNSGADGSGGDAKLFAATGYIPNDAYVSGGYYLTDMFFDTQYTYMNTYGSGGQTRFATDLLTGGSLMLGDEAWPIVHDTHSNIYNNSVVENIGPVTWAIRGNLYMNTEKQFSMRYGSKILVGGNFEGANMSDTAIRNSTQPYTGDAPLGTHNSVYVNGDLTWNNDKLEDKIWLFVNGNVSMIKDFKPEDAKVFVTDMANIDDTNDSDVKNNAVLWAKDKWPDEYFEPGGLFYGLDEVDIPLTYNEAIKELDLQTSTIDYYKWDLSANTKDAQKVKVVTNLDNMDINYDDGGETITLKANARNFFFAYPGSESEQLVKNGEENGAVGKSFIIEDVWTHEADNNAHEAIIIDTGDDPNNIMTIQVSDVTGNGEFAWFVDRPVNKDWSTWPPKITVGEKRLASGMGNNGKRLVLLKGRGTVLIDIPGGVTYTSTNYSFVGHISWWLANGGKITKEGGHLAFKGVAGDAQISPNTVDYVHRYCIEEDDCDFELSEITDEKAAKCVGCGGSLTQVTCDVHGKVNKFCMNCYPENKDRVNWCQNHVDNKKFDEFYSTLSGTEKDWATGSDGKVIYPTTNLMLVSCDESAEMRFSNVKGSSDANLTDNDFFGFIYAPYMTYLSLKSTDGRGNVKLCGGMTVGDYSLGEANAFIGCYPDHMPNELAGMEGGGSMAGGKLKGTTKTWKIDLGGYR